MAFLTDGNATLVGLAIAPGILLREREVQPPEMEIGGIDTTTMRNLSAGFGTPRTQAPKSLKTFGDITMQCQWDPFLYTIAMGIVTGTLVRFPDLSSVLFYCWLDKMTPQSLKEGEFPLLEVKLKHAGLTPVNGGTGRLPATFVPPSYAAGPVADPV